MSNSSNKMSVFQLTILTAVNMMGSGIIMLPSKLAQVGALSIVSLARNCSRFHVSGIRFRKMRHVC